MPAQIAQQTKLRNLIGAHHYDTRMGAGAASAGIGSNEGRALKRSLQFDVEGNAYVLRTYAFPSRAKSSVIDRAALSR